MLEHILNIVPHLDCVKTYLDSMHITYIDITPYYTIGTLDPLAEYNTSNYMVISIIYNNIRRKIRIRKDQWK